MKRWAAVAAGLACHLAFATAGLAQDGITGDAIRDRIRDRMEQKRLERAPKIGGGSKVAGSGVASETIVIKGQVRTFMRYTPNRVLIAGKRVPVVFALHGAKGTADKLQGYLGMNTVADREGFIVVYPQGDKNRWNDGRTVEETAAREVSQADDIEFLNSLADALVAQGVADPKRIYMTGLSNGGFMSLALACSDASRFAAYGPVIASMPARNLTPCKPVRPVPVVMINGTADEFIRFDGAKSKYGGNGGAPPLEVAGHFARLAACKASNETALPDVDGKDGTRVTLRSWTGCRAGAGVAFYTVTGGGHQAPAMGSASAGVILDMFLGTRSRDLDTAEAVWGFFKGYAR